MSVTLRDYQQQAAEAVEEQWKTHQSTMVVLPTGTGKTVLFADIIRRRQPGRTLVIAHREELIHQARRKIEDVTGLDCEIEMADQVASTSLFCAQPVVIASIQTLRSGGGGVRRMHRFKPDDFQTIVIDEFHHATAESYRTVLDYFLQNKEARLLGVTATPDRADEEALGQVCQSVAFNYEIVAAVNDGWLVPLAQQLVTIDGLDFSSIHTKLGDLSNAELAAVMESERNLHGLCSATIDIIGARQTIVFTSSVKHAEMVSNILNRHRSGIAEWICGETDKESRRRTISNVHQGRTQILVNVGVATEGFDVPGVEIVVMGRPTKSRSLYAQMAGRATRPLPGVVDGPKTPEARRLAIAQSRKPSCLIVDFVGNSGRHKLMTAADILGGKYSDEVRALAEDNMRKAGGARNVSAELAHAEEVLEQERLARAERRRVAEEKRRAEEERKKRIVVQARYQSRTVDPFDAYDIEPVTSRTDRSGRVLSDRQRAILRNNIKIDPDSVTYANGKKIIDEFFRRAKAKLCTMKQAATLKRFGFETHDLTFTAASYLIDRIAKNRWKVPADLAPQTAAVTTSAGGDWL